MKFTIKPQLVTGPEGVPYFALTINEMAVHDPFMSECGRFPVDPTKAYGLTMDEALQLRDLNAQLQDSISHAISDCADNFAEDFKAGLVERGAIMRIKTSEMTGAALDWAVAKCEGRKVTGWRNGFVFLDGQPGSAILGFGYCPTTDWAQGGPIIERERIKVGVIDDEASHLIWAAQLSDPWRKLASVHACTGPTPLIAAMRCFIASRLGDEVEVPDALTVTDEKTTLNPNAVWPFRSGGAR